MRHSVLLMLGENLIYQQAPESKPPQGNVELMKDYVQWQQSVKSYIIKTEDREPFNVYLAENDKGEVPIPHHLVEIYFDVISNKNYARFNKNVKLDARTNKVIGIMETCKVCGEGFEQSVDKNEKYFPICGYCLADLKSVVLEKRIKIANE